MSDASSPDPSPSSAPDPASSAPPPDPTASPSSAPFPASDPLAPGQPWAPQAPWTPSPWTPSPPAAPWAPPPPATQWTPQPPATPWTPDGQTPPWSPDASGPIPAGSPPPAGWPTPDGQPPAAGWPPPGTGWPPPGYPPPYAYPGYPQVPGKPATSGGRIVGIVVAALVVLVLTVCGCLCAGGLWLDSTNPDPTAEEPWGYPDDDGWTPPSAGPLIPERPNTERPTVAPTPSKQPITRPTSGPAPVTVVYEVTGAGTVDLAYFDAESDLIHVDGQKLPWRTTIRTNGKSRVMVEARWVDDDGQKPLDCTVTVTGVGKPVVVSYQGYWATSCTPN